MQRQFNEEVIIVSERNRSLAGNFSRSGERGCSRLGFFESQDTLRTRREQVTTKLVEISQGKHRLRPGQVLGQPAVPHLGEAPQLFEHAEGVLAAGAVRERARLIRRPRSLNGVRLGRRLTR